MVRTSCKFAHSVSIQIFGVLALLLLSPSLFAQVTIHVPADQPTIQAAINAANNGDTVLVAPGTYVENINFNGKAITVSSASGSSVTVIDGGAIGSVVTFNHSETTTSVLTGFTIRNGQNSLGGGGILIQAASPTITGNLITNNHAIYGIGIEIANGSPVIRNNTISGNTQCCGTSGSGGGGIHASAGSGATNTSPLISGNTITNNNVNAGGDGGGISADYFSTPTIQGNVIAGNSAYNSGGGVAFSAYGAVAFIENVVVNNSSLGGGSGGGLYLQGPSSSSFTIVGNTIARNTAFDNTSGVYTSVLSPPYAFINNIVVAAGSQTAVTCDPANGEVSPSFSYNDIYSSSGLTQSGNCDFTSLPGSVSVDPMFLSAANGDFHLKLGSPAIDVGNNSVPNLPATDFDGNPRIADGSNKGTAIIDLGAYELGPTSAATLSPSNLTFSQQALGVTSSSQPVALNSSGTTPFQFTSIQITGDYAQTTKCPIISSPGTAPGVLGGNTCTLNVSFTPVVNGPRSGLLTVNGTNGTSLVVSLSGTGYTPAPAVSLSPAALSFSPQLVGTTSAPQPVTLTNSGTAPLNISTISASQPFSQTNNCASTLAPAVNCTINVSFQPTVSGNATGTLSIADNAAGSPHTVSLSGTGNPVPQSVVITLVQHVSKDAGMATSTSLSFPANNTAGNWIAIAIRAGHSGQTFTVKDSRGNTYHQAAQFNVTVDAPNGHTLGLFFAENIAGGANQITVSDTISGTLRIAILEYGGLASASSLDATTAAQGNGNAPNSGSITTTASGDLLLGVASTGGGENFTANTGYVIEERVPAEPNTKLIVEDQVQSVAGAASAGVSLGASDAWGAVVGAFKAATTSVSISPNITSLNPIAGPVGTIVTITGTNFGATQGTSTVTFNGVVATPNSWSTTSISAPVPAGATTGSLVVTVGGVASNGVTFTIPPPSISGLTPPSYGPVGTSVTIAGANFGASQGTSTVTFNGVSAGTASSWSASSITVSVPSGATSGSVIVTVGGVASNGVTFTVTPTITSLTPSSGPVGTSVTIAGTNFGASQGVTNVTFAGVSAGTASSWSSTSMVVIVPAGATTGPVVVTIGGIAFDSSNAVTFTVTVPPPPNITSLSQTSGPAGTPVTISGGNFGVTQGTATVTFNGVSVGTASSWSTNSITVNVPAGASTGSVVVNVGGRASNGAAFAVTPSISSLNPTSGPGNISVTISGNGFGATQGGSTVTFGGIAALAISWSASSINFTVPNNGTAGIVPVLVTVGGVASNSMNFTLTPTIQGLTPASAPVGTAVTISGTDFGATQNSSTVTFGGVLATPTSWSATSVVVPVPTGAATGTGNVVVTVGGQASNGVIFTVTLPPSITSLTPSSGPAGTSVTISGTNFGATQNTSTVSFNGMNAAPFTSWSPTSIVTTVPVGATTGNVIVTVGGIASSGVAFTVTNPGPSITGLSPTSGLAGTSVTITGANFGATQGTSTITFGASAATPTSWSATTIVAPVPAGAAPCNVVVTVGGVASNGAAFEVPPNITSLSPSSGPVGTTFTISGTNFGTSKGFSSVTFSSIPDLPTSWSDTSLVTSVPSGATTGNVVVSVGGYASNGATFTVTPSPTITSLSPSAGPTGTVVTISGSHFGATQGSSTVSFNGTQATPANWSDTSLVVPVPANASTGLVYVDLSGVFSNGITFTVRPPLPQITSLSPTSGIAGTSLTITGTGFGANQGSSSVAFGGVGAGTPTSWSDTSIVVPVPSAAITGGVTVTFSVGGTGYQSNGITFTVLPSIANLSPTSGPAGQSVVTNGGGFGNTQGTSTVTFNGVSATPTAWGPSTIVVPLPPGADSGNVVVTVAGVASNGSPFTVIPTISSVSPTFGPVGTPVTIAGNGFGPTQGTSTVAFSGFAATPTSWSTSSIVSAVPTGAVTGAVVVTVGGHNSNVVSFTVTTPDFSLSTTPSSATVTAGSPASYTENIAATGGFTGSVSLSISGLPAGASGTFNPNPATGASSALTITTGSTTPAGS